MCGNGSANIATTSTTTRQSNNRKNQTGHQFPYNPALTCTYCTHPGHSINQCNAKRHTALLTPKQANITITHTATNQDAPHQQQLTCI